VGVTRRATDRRRRTLFQDAKRITKRCHADPDLSLADVAEAVGTSPRQLQRIFREIGDTEFRAVLLRVRMEAAHRLLSRTTNGLTVTAAARAVGFRGPSALRAAFVRFYGEPPSAVQPESPAFLGTLTEPAEPPPLELD
jgi:AraC-like DNA-binding protein